MASLPANPHFICQRCIRHLSHRPILPISALSVSQSRSLRTTSRPSRVRLPDAGFSFLEFDDKPKVRPQLASSGSSDRLDKHIRLTTRPRQATRRQDESYRTAHLESNPSKPSPPLASRPTSQYAPHKTIRTSPRETDDRELTPSEPSPPLASKPKPEPKASFEPSAPATNVKLGEDFNWYWETLPPTIAQKTQANHFFTKHSTPKFLRSVAMFRQFPESDVPEVAFVGRSNVGKSSLLNALVNADIKEILARTSKTPGCTRTMNLYGVGGHDGVRVRPGKNNGHDKIVGIGGVLIVDLPGYGEGSLAEWGAEIMKYLTNRKQLRRVFVLIDASHGIKDKDRSLLASLRLSGVPHQVLLSKLDKIYIPKTANPITRFDKKAPKSLKPIGSVNALRLTMAAIKAEIKPPVGGGALGELLGVSSEVLVDGKRLGIDAVRVAVLQAVGIELDTNTKKKRKGLVRTMKGNASKEEMARKGIR